MGEVPLYASRLTMGPSRLRTMSRGSQPSHFHQPPEVNDLPRFSPLLICLERSPLSLLICLERSPLRGDCSMQIDLFENLDGPRGGHFLVSEVPLHCRAERRAAGGSRQ